MLRGYGMGPDIACLLKSYWERQRIVPNMGKFLWKKFRTGRILTQGYPESPMIFNTVVDAVVWAVLDVVCGPQEAQHGLGWAAWERNMIFYANYGRIAGQDHEWVQDVLSVTVEMFRRMGLKNPSRRPMPWYAHQVSSRGSGGRKSTRNGRREKEQCFGRGRG